MPAAPAASIDGRVKQAKKVATQAINKAAQINTDETRNRSTRTRAAYKVKADALDLVARILAGKS